MPSRRAAAGSTESFGTELVRAALPPLLQRLRADEFTPRNRLAMRKPRPSRSRAICRCAPIADRRQPLPGRSRSPRHRTILCGRMIASGFRSAGVTYDSRHRHRRRHGRRNLRHDAPNRSNSVAGTSLRARRCAESVEAKSLPCNGNFSMHGVVFPNRTISTAPHSRSMFHVKHFCVNF